jgi:hypothetical protein
LKGEEPAAYNGAGTCYIEFGDNRVGKVDVNFLSGPTPIGHYAKHQSNSRQKSNISARAAVPAGSACKKLTVAPPRLPANTLDFLN